MAKSKSGQNRENKNIKDSSGKYEFANDQLGENMENRYQELTKEGKKNKKCK